MFCLSIKNTRGGFQTCPDMEQLEPANQFAGSKLKSTEVDWMLISVVFRLMLLSFHFFANPSRSHALRGSTSWTLCSQSNLGRSASGRRSHAERGNETSCEFLAALVFRRLGQLAPILRSGLKSIRMGRFQPCLYSVTIGVIVLLLCQVTFAQKREEVALGQAVAKYQKAVAENPTLVEAYMNLGFGYLALDAMEQATEALQNALRLDATSAEVHYWLGRIDYLQGNFAASIPAFETAIHLLSDWSEAHAELGLSYFRMHKYDEAEAAFTEASSLMASSKSHRRRFVPPSLFDKENQEWMDKVAPLSQADIAYYLSLISFERGLFDKTAEYCHQAIRLDPQLADAYFQLGLVHAQSKAWEAAEGAFREAIRMRPQMATAHYHLALLYFKQGKQKEAEKEMEISQQLNKAAEPLQEQRLALMRNQDKASALSNLGLIYLNDKRYEEAIREYQKALWHNPNLAEAHNGIGYTYAMQGRLEEALQAQRRALQLKPQMAEAHAGLGLIWLKRAEVSQSEQDYEAAFAAYRQATELKPDFPEALLNLGDIALQLSRLEEAQAAYEKLLSLQPNHPRVHLALGNICSRQEKFPQAIHHYQLAIKQDANLIEAYYNLGFVAIRKGRFDDAAERFNAALKVRPELPQTHYFLGEIYVEQKRFEQAGRAYQRAIEIQPTFARAYQQLAHLYGIQGIHLDKALKLAQKAVELQPDSADSFNTLSWLYYLNKDYAQAEQAVKKALTLAPDNRLYQEGLKAIQQARQGGNGDSEAQGRK